MLANGSPDQDTFNGGLRAIRQGTIQCRNRLRILQYQVTRGLKGMALWLWQRYFLWNQTGRLRVGITCRGILQPIPGTEALSRKGSEQTRNRMLRFRHAAPISKGQRHIHNHASWLHGFLPLFLHEKKKTCWLSSDRLLFSVSYRSF